MKIQCTCQGAQAPSGEASLPDANTPSQQSQPTCCPTCCPTCADPTNPDHHGHTLTLNPALFRFLNDDATRMSQEIDQAWNNETEQEKRKYEIQELREKKAKGLPDFRYTKSSLTLATMTGGGGGNGGDEGLSQDLERVSLDDGTLKKGRPKDDAPPPASLAG